MKKLLRSAVLATAALGLTTGPAMAAAPDVPQEGARYTRTDPGPQRAAARHEAVEFFWYDCSHSAQLEQPLEQWAARHRDDVTLRRVPAIWPGSKDQPTQLAHARLYYTLEKLGEVDRLQREVFHAVRDREEDLTTEDDATRWAALHGVDQEKFRAAYRSAEVQQDVDAAQRTFLDDRITELPTVVVDGHDRTSPTVAHGVDQMPSALDQLVASTH